MAVENNIDCMKSALRCIETSQLPAALRDYKTSSMLRTTTAIREPVVRNKEAMHISWWTLRRGKRDQEAT